MSWLAEFAGEKKSLYLASVILAIIGVACSIVPYIIMGDMVAKLVGGNRDGQFYLRDGIIMAVFWIGSYVISWQRCPLAVSKIHHPAH